MSKEYKTIAAWGRMLGSNGSYVNQQINRAKEDNAPATAIYERDGEWSTIADIESRDTLRALITILSNS